MFSRFLIGATLVAIVLLTAPPSRAITQYLVRGMVLKVDRPGKSFLVSHDAIPDLMEAMSMSFPVRDLKDIEGVTPGAMVEFTLVVGQESAYAERIRIRQNENVEQDPAAARRLKLLKELASSTSVKPLAVGKSVPDFKLIDQDRRSVTLSQLRGKVVALNFIYTSCALPQFCFRTANNFGVIQKRFNDQMGRDLVLLTVTFDPVRDQPERLAEYAGQWNADPGTWHFLTGSITDIKRVCGVFGVDFFPDEGLINHSLVAVLIDRQGKLAANVEGNQFTAAQLGDLVGAILKR